MKLATKYRLSVSWLFVVAFVSALDVGLAVNFRDRSAVGMIGNAQSIAEFLLHLATLYALRSKFRWGWGLAAVWIPTWVLMRAIDLYRDGDLTLLVMWAPFLCFSAFAHRVIVCDRIRERFGVHKRPWPHAKHLASVNYLALTFVPLALLFGETVASALSLCTLAAITTAPVVYGDFSG
jgi:hypothetical protein